MKWIIKLINYLFLVKEIISKSGVVHFRRYRLIQTPWFALYIHHILKSDEERDMHDHPWDFSSLILQGAYFETWKMSPDFKVRRNDSHYRGDVIKHKAEDVHKITLLTKDVWTLVLTSGRDREWGYRLIDNTWIDQRSYRSLKNKGLL